MPRHALGRTGVKDILSIALVWACLTPQISPAQTCEEPLTLSTSDWIVGSTCSASNVLPILGGSLPSPNPDVIYAFDVMETSDTDVLLAGMTGIPFYIALLANVCDTESPIMALVTSPGTTSLRLDPGRYYAVVSTEPEPPPAQCGDYQVMVHMESTPDSIFRGDFEPGQ